MRQLGAQFADAPEPFTTSMEVYAFTQSSASSYFCAVYTYESAEMHDAAKATAASTAVTATARKRRVLVMIRT